MNKVTLPKEVAEAIEELRANGWSNSTIAATTLNTDAIYHSSYKSTFAILYPYFIGERKEDDLLTALVNGYEVEQTPEEKVREYYEKLEEHKNWTIFEDVPLGEMQGAVIKTLDLLGIKISGVNAE
jgi:hypothetical protein